MGSTQRVQRILKKLVIEFDNCDYTIPLSGKFLGFSRVAVSLLAPAVTNKLGACRSFIGTKKCLMALLFKIS